MAEAAPYLVILNPAASGGRGRKLLPRLRADLDRRGIPYRLRVTEAPGHARTLVSEGVALGSTRVLVVGGDGTIHEVANGILEAPASAPALAVLPVGTGNDFFRMVSPSRELKEALDTLLLGRVERFEVGRASFDGGTSHFVNLLGVGLDVEVLRRRSEFRRLSGLPQYLAALTATVVSFRPWPLRIEFLDDGDRKEGPVMLGILTVGPSIGGGFLLSPQASPLDGHLDFCAVDPVGILKVARYVPRVIRGTHADIPEFHFRRVKRIRLSRPDDGPFFFELDGELMPDQTRFLEVEVLPGALPVVLPERGRES